MTAAVLPFETSAWDRNAGGPPASYKRRNMRAGRPLSFSIRHLSFVIPSSTSPILDRLVLLFRFALRFPLQHLLVALLRVQQPLRLLRRHLPRLDRLAFGVLLVLFVALFFLRGSLLLLLFLLFGFLLLRLVLFLLVLLLLILGILRR